MRRRIIPIIIVLIVIAGGVLAWRLWHTGAPASRLTLYGDIDVRQVDLAFKVAGRIAALTVDEGDAVKRGQVLASLDKSYFDDDIRLQQARIAGQSANLLKLKHGSRPEEIAQARAAAQEKTATARIAIEDSMQVARLELDGLIGELSAEILKRILPAGTPSSHEQAG